MVIIVAAGKGSRFGSEVPKQFCLLGGRPVLMTTIEKFSKVVDFNEIYLVVSDEMKDYWLDLCRQYNFTSPRIISGGATRLDSVWNALKAIAETDNVKGRVMIHDGARPLISVNMIRRLAESRTGSQLVPVVPVTDSLRCRCDDGLTEAVDRSRYSAVQTPQTFDFQVVYDAYRALDDTLDKSKFTDDASVVEAYLRHPVETVEGEPTNIKITNPLDLAVAEAILKATT